MKRRRLLRRVTGLCIAIFFLSGLSSWAAEKYPRRPITFVIPMEPGSFTDSNGRPLAEAMQKELGQPIMVVNKPGAAGTIGLRDVQAAKPDGYTIGLMNTAHYAKLMGLVPFDHHDLTVIGVPSGGVPSILCGAERPWKTVKEFADYAKSRPGEVKAAVVSKGGYWWLAAKAFERAAGLKLNMLVQPGGGAMVVTQVAGGHVDMGVCGLPESSSQVRGGTLRYLAVFSRQRIQGYEQVPTLVESGFNIEVVAVLSLVAPKDLPKPIYDTLVQTFEKVVKNKSYQDTIAQMGGIVPGMTREKAVKYLDEQVEVLKPVLQESGLMK